LVSLKLAKKVLEDRYSTHSALVGTLGVIESVNVEPFLRNLALDVTLVNNVLPELLGALGSWKATCHTNDGGILRHMSNLLLGRDGGCVSGSVTRLMCGIRESIDGGSRIVGLHPRNQLRGESRHDD
jgi:hypothetical protein